MIYYAMMQYHKIYNILLILINTHGVSLLE